MAEWLDLLHNSVNTLAEDAEQLKGIARTLKRVGSDKLADEIYEIAYRMNKCGDDLLKSTNLKITDDVKNAEAMTGTLLSAIITKDQKKQSGKEQGESS